MTQIDRVLAHLAQKRPITPMVALRRYGVFRLAARIHELKQYGLSVRCNMVRRGGKKWAEIGRAHV